MNWDAVRAQFPALTHWTYLNTATFGQVPDRSKTAMDEHFRHRNELACSDFTGWFDDMNALRGLIGRLIGCQADDVAFVQNASAALSLLMGGIEWKPGDQVLSLEGEFPNQLYYPAYLASRGVELIVAPCGELLDHLTSRTRLVAISTVNYSNGFASNVTEIGRVLRERGVLFYLDGTQSVGALQIDLAQVHASMFAVNCYKWMLSPNGAAFAYVAPELRATLAPSVIGWRSDRNWHLVDSLNQGTPQFCEAAEKYEGGMLNFSALYALSDTIRMMLELGAARIEERVLQLAGRVRQIVETCGAQVLYPGSQIVAARFPGVDAATISAGLKQHRILTAARHGRLRVSPHFYNNEADLDRFASVLQLVAAGEP